MEKRWFSGAGLILILVLLVFFVGYSSAGSPTGYGFFDKFRMDVDKPRLAIENDWKSFSKCSITISPVTEDLPGFFPRPNNEPVTYLNARVLEFEAAGCGTNKGFNIDTDFDGIYEYETDRILLFWNENLRLNRFRNYNLVSVYYEMDDSSIGYLNLESMISRYSLVRPPRESILFEINYREFNNAYVTLWEISPLLPGVGAQELAVLRMDMGMTEYPIINGTKPTIWFDTGFVSGSNNDGLDKLGLQRGEDIRPFFRYAPSLAARALNNSIASYDEDVLLSTGVIIRDLQSNHENDRIVLEIPYEDQSDYVRI